MMKDKQLAASVGLFFQSFAKHLKHIRDEGKDARQAYRAQILLGQLQHFEKAIMEHYGQAQTSGWEGDATRGLLEATNFETFVKWLGTQKTAPLAGLFFLNQKGQWEQFIERAPFPDKLKIKHWLQRGILGRTSHPQTFVAYLYGQPRLMMIFSEKGDPGAEHLARFALFIARLLPLYITAGIKDPMMFSGNKSGLIARDMAILELLSLIEQAAKKDVSILLEGESGTGKEVIAQFIHHNSSRARKSLVAVNCAAIPAGLIESELFGHEKGAFTGAYNRQIGRVEEANGGTLFLDEIGEMELAMQAKLLRFLQLHEFHRVGGKKKISVDVRIVAATNKNIKQQVSEGKFREDLYYRLAVMPFKVPPLRERVDDIVPLARFFLEKYAREFGGDPPEVDELVFHLLAAYHFPGNVRELENLIQNILVVSQGGKILPSHLPEPIRAGEVKGRLVLNEKGVVRTWRKVNRRVRKMSIRTLMGKTANTHAPQLPGIADPESPKDNASLKKRKQQIQDYASQLILELERRFLDDLLERAQGSMPRAAKLGNINRTLLYKMVDRTRNLE